jgi:hypothetical protein
VAPPGHKNHPTDLILARFDLSLLAVAIFDLSLLVVLLDKHGIRFEERYERYVWDSGELTPFQGRTAYWTVPGVETGLKPRAESP